MAALIQPLQNIIILYRIIRPNDQWLGPEDGTNLIKFKLVFKTELSNRLKITTSYNISPYFDITHSYVI